MMRTRSGTLVGVGEAVLDSVLDVVSNILFSEDVVNTRVQGDTLFSDLVAVLEDWTRPNVSDAFPFLAPIDLLGSRHRVSRGLTKLYKFFDEEFVERRLLANGENHGDLLDVVLARHAKSGRITVEWAMALLLKHQDKMKKVQAELVATLGSKDFVEERDLNKLPYLQAVIKETLRLQPPAPLLPRQVVKDGMSLGGFSVPIGTYILVNLWAIGRDPTVWPRPEEFLPERFLGKQAADFRGLDFAYKPFGAGRRMCPGLDFATRLVPPLLASILHKIEWRLPGGMAPKDVDLRDRYSTVLELAKPLHAVPVCML
ncbi:cytochrome P450 76M5-like [Setaria viridis]|nr:cytochrome P450 76M5-like [Setaria viridis]